MTGSGDPSLSSATNLVKHKVEGCRQDTEPASPIFISRIGEVVSRCPHKAKNIGANPISETILPDGEIGVEK